MAQIKCFVVTPESTALEQTTTFVVVPLFDGELGIAPGHAPLIGRLGYGELRLAASDGSTDRYYVDGGFVQVRSDEVSIITGRFIRASDLDAELAQQHLKSAMKRPASTDELLQLRDRAVEQARAQIRVAQRVES